MYFMFNPTYFLFVLPAFLIALWAQAKVRSAFARGSQVRLQTGVRGVDVARTILSANGLNDVNVEMIPGTLSDHYDPRKRVLRLSSPVYNGANAAAVGVAAHEAGHALQHAAGYVPIGIRNSILPMAQLGSGLAIPMFFIGLFFSHTGMAALMTIGIILFSFAVVFHIVTLPVEVNASRRALAMLGESGVFTTEEELDAAKNVLTAAALTYVAGALQAVLTLLYMLSRRR